MGIKRRGGEESEEESELGHVAVELVKWGSIFVMLHK